MIGKEGYAWRMRVPSGVATLWVVSLGMLIDAGQIRAQQTARESTKPGFVILDELVAGDLADPGLDYRHENALREVVFFGERIENIGQRHRECDDEVFPDDHDERTLEYSREIAEIALHGRTSLPGRAGYSRPGAASLARLLSELIAAGNMADAANFVKYPAFADFIMKPLETGYCIRTAPDSVVDKASTMPEISAAGIRRLSVADPNSANSEFLYLYRPRHLSRRLREGASGLLLPDEVGVAQRLTAAADSADSLLRYLQKPQPKLAPYSFVDERAASTDILSGAENDVPGDIRYVVQIDLPLDMGQWRMKMAGGQRPPSLREEQWRALRELASSCPVLAGAKGSFVLRLVSDRSRTRGRLIAPLGDERRSGVTIHLFALDEVARLDGGAPDALQEKVQFFSDAISVASAR